MSLTSTYNIASASVFYPSRPQKKSAKPSAFYTFEYPQLRRSAFYRRPPLPGTARSRTSAMALGNRGYPVVSIPTDANSHTTDWNRNNVQLETQPDTKHPFSQTSEHEFCCLHSTSSRCVVFTDRCLQPSSWPTHQCISTVTKTIPDTSTDISFRLSIHYYYLNKFYFELFHI